MALMPLIYGHDGFQRDSMGINRIQEYPFKKLNMMGFMVVFGGKRKRLKSTNINRRKKTRGSFQSMLAGSFNNHIVAATSDGTFLRPSVTPRYSTSPSRLILVQTDCLPLTSENGTHEI